MKATQKTVTVIARYAHKTDGKLNRTVTYLIKSSDGKSQYCTTLIDGEASGCSCPSRSKCYHKSQLETREQERKVVATQFAAKSAPTWTVQLVKAGTLVAPKHVVETVSQENVTPVVDFKPREVSTDLSTKGNLNVSRPFSILKPAS